MILATDGGMLIVTALSLLVGGWAGWKARGFREKFKKGTKK